MRFIFLPILLLFIFGKINAQEEGAIFKETTDLAGISFSGGTFGHAWGDINGVGVDDLFITGHGKPYL